MPTYPHQNKRLSEIWLFYANIIGYVRLVLIIISVFAVRLAVSRNSFGWALFAFVCNYTGGWLLDWLDGPIARSYRQCTVFGAGFDWYCDLLADIVYIFWAAELRLWLAPWILIFFALELGSALIDTNNVATGYQWAEFAPKYGLTFHVLNIVYPNGHYSKYGTALWILYSTWISCHLLLAHTPTDYIRFTMLLRGLSATLIPVVFGSVLHKLAYLIALISGWKEPVGRVIQRHDN